MKARRDFVDDHIRVAERIRQLEIRSDALTIQPQAPVPDNGDLDILTQIVAHVGAWDTAESDGIGQAIGWTARSLLEELWGGGWFPELRQYVSTFADIDNFSFINPDTGNPYTASEWNTFIDSVDDNTQTPWGRFGDGFSNFYSKSIAADWWGLLMDVGAFPSQSYYREMVPAVGTGAGLGYGDPFIDEPYTPYLVGGPNGGSPSLAGILKRERMLYFGGLPAIGGGVALYRYMLAQQNGLTPFAAAKGCPSPPIPVESELLRPGVSEVYDTGFPYRANQGACAREPGGYVPMSGPSSGDYRWYIGFSGQYTAPDGSVHACSVAGADVDGGIPHYQPGVVGQPTEPYIGAELCPANPLGSYTDGCTGVIVVSASLPPSDVAPIMMPVPYQVEPEAAASPSSPDYYANVWVGFASIPEINWPGFDGLKARIQAVIHRYPAVLSWLRTRLPTLSYDGTLPVYATRPFPNDGTWQQVPITAPWRGRVECRVIGRHVHLRGFVLTHGNPRDSFLFTLPTGIPAPGSDAISNRRQMFLAGSGKHPGPPLGGRFVGGTALHEPLHQHKDIVPIEIVANVDLAGVTRYLVRSLGDTTGLSPNIYGLGNKSGGTNAGRGYHAVMLDGISYIGAEGFTT